ncbi:MAG: Octanoyltransferase LipM [Elusimicrobia bacterium]|nr:Octanoyltransferase LipM [Elusimicrobiota bacterium]
MLATQPTFKIVDSGPLPGERNMEIDRAALEDIQLNALSNPILRFFEWTTPTVTYGYLLEFEEVKKWASPHGALPLVKRPTGGGAVLHSPSDLSLSLLWPRGMGYFSETPRACYAEIHSIILKTLISSGEIGKAFLYKAAIPTKAGIQASHPSFKCKSKDWIPASAGMTKVPACFQEPVCNDLMQDGKKILGGALRITRDAILYQGTLQIAASIDWGQLKNRLAENFNHGR